ncbi:MAG: thiamine phosphate synthase [Bryobacterales bacterium]|nr:thiamine phosphate synthase [Bryobacterales bacterium]
MNRLLPRVYPIVDTAALALRGYPPVPFAESLLEAGASILQFRHKEHFSRATFQTATLIRDLCRQAGAALVINDRADIAALLDAGLHLGQDDLPPALARRILGPDALLGFSTHNAAQLLAAANEPVSYLAIGPIFSTASKENPDPQLGLASLGSIRAATTRPLVAIGGITLDTAPSVWAAGADTIAVIADLLSHGTDQHSTRKRMELWLNL